ncbi:hypothetical protein ABK040_013673 [Willaertia magna]
MEAWNAESSFFHKINNFTQTIEDITQLEAIEPSQIEEAIYKSLLSAKKCLMLLFEENGVFLDFTSDSQRRIESSIESIFYHFGKKFIDFENHFIKITRQNAITDHAKDIEFQLKERIELTSAYKLKIEDLSEQIKRNEIQMDFMRGQLMRRDLRLKEQREQLFKEIILLREQLLKHNDNGDIFTSMSWNDVESFQETNYMDEEKKHRLANLSKKYEKQIRDLIEAHNEEIVNLQNSFDDEIRFAKKENNKIQKEVEELKERLEQKDRDMQDLRRYLEDVEEQLIVAQNDKDTLLLRLDEVEKTNFTLKRLNQQREDEYISLKERHDKLREETTFLTYRNKQYTVPEIKVLLFEREEALEKLRVYDTTKDHEKHKLRMIIEELSTRTEKQRLEIKSFKDKIFLLQTDLETTKDSVEEKSATLNSVHLSNRDIKKSYELQVEFLRQELGRKTEEVENLSLQLGDLKSKLEEKGGLNAQESEALRQELRELGDKLIKKNTEVQTVLEDKERLEHIIENLTNDLEESRKSVGELREAILLGSSKIFSATVKSDSGTQTDNVSNTSQQDKLPTIRRVKSVLLPKNKFKISEKPTTSATTTTAVSKDLSRDDDSISFVSTATPIAETNERRNPYVDELKELQVKSFLPLENIKSANEDKYRHKEEIDPMLSAIRKTSIDYSKPLTDKNEQIEKRKDLMVDRILKLNEDKLLKVLGATGMLVEEDKENVQDSKENEDSNNYWLELNETLSKEFERRTKRKAIIEETLKRITIKEKQFVPLIDGNQVVGTPRLNEDIDLSTSNSFVPTIKVPPKRFKVTSPKRPRTQETPRENILTATSQSEVHYLNMDVNKLIKPIPPPAKQSMTALKRHYKLPLTKLTDLRNSETSPENEEPQTYRAPRLRVSNPTIKLPLSARPSSGKTFNKAMN